MDGKGKADSADADAMSGHASKMDGPKRSKGEKTIAELVCYFATRQLRRKLEDFRIEWEIKNGPIDITRHYTSMLTSDEQEFLMKAEPKRYFDGLPTFVQDFIREAMREAAAEGSLDNMPSSFLRMYMRGEMESVSRASNK